MRFLILLIIPLLFLSGCGGHKLSTGHARNTIVAMPQEILEKEDIEVVDVIQTSNSSAVAETRVKTAFRLQKKNGEWEVHDIRIGHGRWEEASNLSEALKRVQTEETNLMLERIAGAVREHYKATGSLPEFKDYVSLSDILAPKYLDPLIRLDSWRNPLNATKTTEGAVSIVSAGPDGRFSTGDDLRITINP